MNDKPSKITTSDDLLNYYWEKSDLILFCKNHRLPTQGAKAENIQRNMTYGDLIVGWIAFENFRKKLKSTIAPQFEYNQ
jgi:hypothetical protein